MSRDMSRHMGRHMGRYMVMVWIMALLGGTGMFGCSVAVEVRAREEISFVVDMDQLLSSNKLDKKKLFPEGRIPRDYRLTLPFWIPITYDLRQNEDLKKYQSKIRDLRFQQLSYTVSQNTLSVDLPSQNKGLDVFLAEKGKTESKDFTKIGFFYPIPAQRVHISDRLQLEKDGEATAGGYFQQFAFTLGIQGALVLDGSQDPTIPTGRLVLKVAVEVTFVVDLDLSAPP